MTPQTDHGAGTAAEKPDVAIADGTASGRSRLAFSCAIRDLPCHVGESVVMSIPNRNRCATDFLTDDRFRAEAIRNLRLI